jgi:hypothetical protein
MGILNLTIVNPNDETGTPVYDVSRGVDPGDKKLIGVSRNWSTRLRASADKGGCPSWIDQIVIAPNDATARKTTVKATQAAPIASSSFSSRDVVAIILNSDGNENQRAIFPYVYVAAFHDSGEIDKTTGKPIPIADELWFAQTPVNDKRVTDAEAECNHPLE